MGAWYASSFVNPIQLTKLLSSSVKNVTGRELYITGPVNLNFFPSISVKAERVSLSNASWASNSNMLTIQEIELDIRFLPLLSGSVELSNLGIKGVDVNLQTNKSGEGNWILSTPVADSQKSPSQIPTQDSASNADNPFFAIETIKVTNATIRYQEGSQAEKVMKLPRLDLDSSDGKSTILIDLQYANYALNLKGKTGLMRKVYAAWNQLPVKIDLDLDLSLNGKALAIKGEIDKKPQALPQFQIDLNSKSFDLVPLAASAAAAGKAGGTVPEKTHQAQGKYFFSNEPLPFDLLPIANGYININIAELSIPGQAPFSNLKATLQFKKNSIDANDVSFNIGKGMAQSQISIANFDGPAPKIFTKGLAKGFTLEQISASTDSAAKVTGGDAQLVWNVQGSGARVRIS